MDPKSRNNKKRGEGIKSLPLDKIIYKNLTELTNKNLTEQN